MRFLFHHIPKCAGRYLITRFRAKRYKDIQYSFNGKKIIEMDIEDLDHYPDLLLETEDLFPYHYNWHKFVPVFKYYDTDTIIKTIRRYKENNYIPFTFVRDPREALCSLYFYYWEKHRRRIDDKWYTRHRGLHPFRKLNGFLKNVNVRFIPEWWEEFDFVGVVEPEQKDLKLFFNKYFGIIPSEDKEAIVGKSPNKGYDYWCEQGIITEETQEHLESSADFKVFQDLIQRYK